MGSPVTIDQSPVTKIGHDRRAERAKQYLERTGQDVACPHCLGKNIRRRMQDGKWRCYKCRLDFFAPHLIQVISVLPGSREKR